jgi:hypothetical protein
MRLHNIELAVKREAFPCHQFTLQLPSMSELGVQAIQILFSLNPSLFKVTHLFGTGRGRREIHQALTRIAA